MEIVETDLRRMTQANRWPLRLCKMLDRNAEVFDQQASFFTLNCCVWLYWSRWFRSFWSFSFAVLSLSTRLIGICLPPCSHFSLLFHIQCLILPSPLLLRLIALLPPLICFSSSLSFDLFLFASFERTKAPRPEWRAPLYCPCIKPLISILCA